MLKRAFNYFVLIFTSGILFHRSTILGVLCALWVYSGAEVEQSAMERMMTPDLYLFMASFLFFYRLLFKRILKPDGDFNWKAMAIYTFADLLWAVAAMFCAVPALVMTNYSGQNYSEKMQKIIKARTSAQ